MTELPLLSRRQEPENPATATLVNAAGWDNWETPPAGLGYLTGYANEKLHRVKWCDLNLEYLNGLVDQHTLLEQAQDRTRLLVAAHNSGELPHDPITYSEAAMLAAVPFRLGRAAMDGFNVFMREEEAERGVVVGQRYYYLQFGEAGGPQFQGRVDRFLTVLRKLDMADMFGLFEKDNKKSDLPYVMDRAAHLEGDVSYYDQLISDRLIPRLEQTETQLAGISINSTNQIVPGVRLASLIRRALPDIQILMGGNQITYKEHIFRQAAAWLGEIVDGLVYQEGEQPFLMCLNTVNDPDKWELFPNVGVYKDGELRPPAQRVRTKPDIIPDYSSVVTLSDEPLSYASSREDLQLTRGCYSPHCLFCTQDKGTTGTVGNPKSYQQPEKGFIPHMLKTLNAQGRDTFYFVDETLPPKTLEEVANGIIDSMISVNWGSYARFERPFDRPELANLLRESGCRFLEMGLESASQRVLDAMGKRIEMQTVREGLNNLLEAGIEPHLFIMFGFPTETEEEAQMTLDFMREYGQRGVQFSCEVFTLMPDAMALDHCEELGIELLTPREKLAADRIGLREATQGADGKWSDGDWRRTKGISIQRAWEVWAEAKNIQRQNHVLNRIRELTEDSEIVLNGYAGLLPGVAVQPLREQFDHYDTALALRGGSDFTLEGEELGDYATLVQTIFDSHVASDNVAELIGQFTGRPVTIQEALNNFCAEQGMNVRENGDSLRRLISSLVDRGILVVSK